jgi:hypothetical protein
MLSFYAGDYKPEPGQLCKTFKGKDAVYPVTSSLDTLEADPLVSDEIVLITKSEYHKEFSSYYVEFMRDNRLFYTYFYEQVFHFTQDETGDEVLRLEEPHLTFDYPWVLCD